MELFGNNSDPLAKTLAEMEEKSKNSGLGNAGDFFKPVHERDPHVKAKNRNQHEVEFNSAILNLNDSSVMQKFIHLKNKIVSGECLAIGENLHIDKEDGSTSVFIQWLQPKGMFQLGTANAAIGASEVKKKEQADAEGEDVVDDTQPAKKKRKGKGTRKTNTNPKVKM